MIQQSFNQILASLLGSAFLKESKQQTDIAKGNVETLYTEEGEAHVFPGGAPANRTVGGTSEDDPIRQLYTAEELARIEAQKAEAQAYGEGEEHAYSEMETAFRRGFTGEPGAFGGPLYNEAENRLRGMSDAVGRASFQSALRASQRVISRQQRGLAREEREQAKARKAERRKTNYGGPNV